MTLSDGREQYYTPPPVTRALLGHLEGMADLYIAEPCAGDGWISRELARDGHQVITGDIDESLDVDNPGLSLFDDVASRIYRYVDAIITNPPWSDAALSVRRALEITPNVAMLLRLTFLEPCSKRQESARVDLLEQHRSHIVLPRISFYRGGDGTDSAPPAWFIWGFEDLDIPPWAIVSDRELLEYAGQQDLFEGAQCAG